MSRLWLTALLAFVVTGCFVTTDENLWRQRPEAGVDTGVVDGVTTRDRAAHDGPGEDVPAGDGPAGDGPAGDGPAQDVVVPDAPLTSDTTGKLANGSACSSPGVCASGQCADGVCCASTCGGVCEACNLAGHVGVCWPVSAGQDPDSECAKQATSTCGRDGACDGKGACRLHASGTVCAAATCVTSTSSRDKQCDGKGSCNERRAGRLSTLHLRQQHRRLPHLVQHGHPLCGLQMQLLDQEVLLLLQLDLTVQVGLLLHQQGLHQELSVAVGCFERSPEHTYRSRETRR